MTISVERGYSEACDSKREAVMTGASAAGATATGSVGKGGMLVVIGRSSHHRYRSGPTRSCSRPYRLLEAKPELNGGELDAVNMLLQGGNLYALKASDLLPTFGIRDRLSLKR